MLDSYSWRRSAGSTTCESNSSLLLPAANICLAVFPSNAMHAQVRFAVYSICIAEPVRLEPNKCLLVQATV